ncbi:caspase domain protein [Synechococcus sp. PCC 7335]|uniref:caspase family protein n=1 Tax=Synechococcus sp. (strain ATCC 29403 / PCC 7335) TaxID=91464 RepID=UPI00017EBCEC|nr:caspase family protein [Synechococcus sp. PCC 7335]EDX82429.1 caspase domain protein [Synechococcus sp. PCC 7335]
MTKVALLIGVSEYEPELSPLPAATKDAAALKKVLSDPEMGEFDEVKILTNPDRQDMQYEIETLFADRHRDDFILLFFSGHGIKDDSNSLYFASRITRKSPKGNLVVSTAVPARFIHDVMNKSRAKRQVLILDCCFSGAFDPALQTKDDGSVDLRNQLGSEGRVVLASSSSTQYSFEQQGSELSLYTRHLIEGIETGAGDHNEDGKISMRELHDYATSKVQETAPSMTPKLITLKDMGFDIVLAKAKVTDPQLSYRRQVERYASHGEISSIGRTILDQRRSQLGIDLEAAQEIEATVLKPYQERLENIQRYRYMFSDAIERKYPLTAQAQSELEDLREVLGLRQEDVAEIKQEFAEQIEQTQETKKLEHQKNLQRYEQEFQKAVRTEYPIGGYVREGLQKFQKSLGLQEQEVESIERPILAQKEVSSQKELTAKKTASSQNAPQPEPDWLNYRRKLQQYEEEFRKAVATEYPLSESEGSRLTHLQRSLQLKSEDIQIVKSRIVAQTALNREVKTQVAKDSQPEKTDSSKKGNSSSPHNRGGRELINRGGWGFLWAAGSLFYLQIILSMLGGEESSSVMAIFVGMICSLIGGVIYGQPSRKSKFWVIGAIILAIILTSQVAVLINDGNVNDGNTYNSARAYVTGALYAVMFMPICGSIGAILKRLEK